MMNDVQHMLQIYKEIGTPAAVFITFIETFLPFLPLTAFVALNTAAYGLFKGFILSWIGSTLACWLLYWIIRSFRNHTFVRKMTSHSKFHCLQEKFNQCDMIYTSIFFLLPVFPNTVATVIAAVNEMDFKRFAISSSTGIGGFFFFISYGVTSLASPVKLISFLAIFIAYFFISKKVSNRVCV